MKPVLCSGLELKVFSTTTVPAVVWTNKNILCGLDAIGLAGSPNAYVTRADLDWYPRVTQNICMTEVAVVYLKSLVYINNYKIKR